MDWRMRENTQDDNEKIVRDKIAAKMIKIENKITDQLALQMRQVGNLRLLCAENHQRDLDNIAKKIQDEIGTKIGYGLFMSQES